MQILDIRYFDLKIISQNFTQCVTAIETKIVWCEFQSLGKLNYFDSRNIVALIMNATYVTSATTSSTRLQADSSKSQSHHAVLNNLSSYIYSKTCL